MPFVELERRRVEIRQGDTIASALWRAGVRVFSRSFKFRRPRGLYCVSGDCPNCLVTVDGEPGVRACCTPAREGQRVTRDVGWPSADRDWLSPVASLAFLLPVGTLYKTFIRPRSWWPVMDRLLRRFAGVGRVREDAQPTRRRTVHHHPDLLVIGGGVAGLTAALAGANAGERVLLAEEHAIGEMMAPGPVRDRVGALRADLQARGNVTILERAPAIGIYEGLLVPVDAPDFLHQVHPSRIVVATGAAERHAAFPGSDLPGVWLGRGAARMAGVHGMRLGRELVFAGATAESLEHLQTLLASGTGVKVVVVPEPLVASVPAGLRVIAGGEVVAARGRGRVRSVIVESPAGREAIGCEGLVVSLGLEPRDGLLRQAPPGAPVTAAGDVARPTPADDGRKAGGFVCLCEDTMAEDLADAWAEGFKSTQLLKRYTKTTTGPCQGTLCHPHLRALAARQGGVNDWTSGPTTARPPIRPIRFENAAAGFYELTEQRTSLHQRHVDLGAKMELVGPWLRPQTYGDLASEYWAVRGAVSVMDVSTLGKYLVTGRDAVEFLERLYPCHVRDIAEGRLRYALLLNEGGYVVDDGLIGSLGAAGYNLTFTSSGADGIEGWLRDWIDTWKLKVHVVNQTAAVGAINVAGPRARELLQRLTSDPVDNASLGYSRQREITVAGIRCRALRVGFVGEMSVELHHPRSQSPHLWDALLSAGAEFGLKPHGMDALRVLRLEKGHILIGQDTDFDTTPAKLGLDWAVKMDKPYFVGKMALERIAATRMVQRLAPIMFEGPVAPTEGAALSAGGEHAGYLTSARFSPALERGVALGWIRRIGEEFPTAVQAEGIPGRVVSGPFYDPKGEKLRA